MRHETTTNRTDTMKIALIGCGKNKTDDPREADELYTSSFFWMKLLWAFRQGFDEVAILSAEHGIIAITADERFPVIEPYNNRLDDLSKAEREMWAAHVQYQMAMEWPGADLDVTVLAGASYREAFPDADCPVEGMGIGQQRSFFSN